MVHREYLSPAEFYKELVDLQARNHKIRNIMGLCDNNWTKLPPHTQRSILKVLKIQENTNGYYREYQSEEEATNASLESVVRQIRKEIHETK